MRGRGPSQERIPRRSNRAGTVATLGGLVVAAGIYCLHQTQEMSPPKQYLADTVAVGSVVAASVGTRLLEDAMSDRVSTAEWVQVWLAYKLSRDPTTEE